MDTIQMLMTSFVLAVFAKMRTSAEAMIVVL